MMNGMKGPGMGIMTGVNTSFTPPVYHRSTEYLDLTIPDPINNNKEGDLGYWAEMTRRCRVDILQRSDKQTERRLLSAGLRGALRYALSELRKSNPDHPLLDKKFRQKLFESYARQEAENLIAKDGYLYKSPANNNKLSPEPATRQIPQEYDVDYLYPGAAEALSPAGNIRLAPEVESALGAQLTESAATMRARNAAAANVKGDGK